MLSFFLTSGFSQKPMEPAKRTLYVQIHGVNPEEYGMAREDYTSPMTNQGGAGKGSDENRWKCPHDFGIGGNTFHRKGVTEYLVNPPVSG